MALGVGYLLGRKRKLRRALLFGVVAASGRLTARPAARLLGGEPDGAAGGRAASLSHLGDAGRAAARTALSKPLELLTERLNDGADTLRQSGRPKEGAGGQRDGQQPQGGQQQGGQQQNPGNRVSAGDGQ